MQVVRAICEQSTVDDSCLRRSFGEAAQFDFGLSVAGRMGYDLERYMYSNRFGPTNISARSCKPSSPNATALPAAIETSTPAEFALFMRKEADRWSKVLADVDIRYD